MKHVAIITILFSGLFFSGCQTAQDFARDTFYEEVDTDNDGQPDELQPSKVAEVSEALASNVPVPFIGEIVSGLFALGGGFLWSRKRERRISYSLVKGLEDYLQTDQGKERKEEILGYIKAEAKKRNAKDTLDKIHNLITG